MDAAPIHALRPEHRVLVVGDELRCKSLALSSTRVADEWQVKLAHSGARAKATMANVAYDVIVLCQSALSDMSGAQFLEEVMTRSPASIRLLVEEPRGPGEGMEQLVHRVIKSDADGVLEAALRSACALRRVMDVQVLAPMVGGIESLPSRPTVYKELTDALNSDVATMGDVAGIIKRDIAMCTKVLQLVNSSFIGVRQRVNDVERAVTFIGGTMLTNLVLSYEVFKTFDRASKRLDLDLEHRLAFHAAGVARKMFSDRVTADDAFTAAMLRRVGKLVLAQYCPTGFDEVESLIERLGWSEIAAEKQVLGASHGVVGAYLLSEWGLPYPIFEAVAHYEAPWASPCESLDLIASTHIASELIGEEAGVRSSFIEKIGVADDVPEWHLIAESLAEGAKDES